MLVKDIMVTQVITVSPFAKVREALSLMKRHKVKCLVVDKANEHDAYGLITYSTIIKTIVAESGDIDLINVYDVCAKPAIAVGQDLAIKHVARLMTSYGFNRILVLDNNNLVGLITITDIIDTILDMVE